MTDTFPDLPDPRIKKLTEPEAIEITLYVCRDKPITPVEMDSRIAFTETGLACYLAGQWGEA